MLRLEPAESVACVIADGPYGCQVAEWDMVPDYGAWVQEAYRVLRPGGVAYIFGFTETLAAHWTAFPPGSRMLIWHFRNRAAGGARFWGRSHEGIVAFAKGAPRFFPDEIREEYGPTFKRLSGKRRAATPSRFGEKVTTYLDCGGAWPRDVITGPALSGGLAKQEGRWHPTQKPLWLIKRLILSATQPGELVADLFSGSGTGAVAAQILGRRWLAIERDPAYISRAYSRLREVRDVRPH